MSRFASAREAKEFLVSRITVEAQRERVPLSEVERQMLYFTETAWAPPDIRLVAEKFDHECDQGEYEKKVARLIRNARGRARREDKQEFDAWSDAICALSREDRYLLIMVDQADRAGPLGRPRGDVLKLVGTALAVVCVLLLGDFAETTYDPRHLLPWAIAACVAGACVLSYIFLGPQRMSRFVRKLLGFPDWRR